MNHFANSFAIWLGDYYLLSTALLALVLIGIAVVKQPAQRLAIVKATLVAMALLAALCALPRWSVIHLLTAAPQPTPRATAPQSNPPINNQPAHIAIAAAPHTRAPEIATAPAQSAIELPPTRNWPQITWQIALTAAAVLGALAAATWLAIGLLAAHRLRRSATPAPTELAALLAELSASRRDASTWSRPSDRRFAVAKTRTIDLLISPRINVPVALGIHHPAILLPARQIPLPFREGPGEGSASFADSHADLRSILAHELAHIRNHDLFWLAISRALLTTLWANPLYWLLRRRMRLDQESLADAAAAELTDRQHYAEHLVAWARTIAGQRTVRVASAVGLWEGPSQLRHRIALLMNDKLRVLSTCPRGWRRGSAIAAIMLAGLLSLITIQPASSDDKKDAKSVSLEPAVVKDEFLPITGSLVVSQTEPNSGHPNTIEGLCVDENGKPLPGVKVVLARVEWRDGQREQLGQQLTGADGEFHFEKVIDIASVFPKGKGSLMSSLTMPTLQVSALSKGRVSVTQRVPQRLAAFEGAKVNLTLPPAVTVRGRVLDPDNMPVSNALVSIGESQLDHWEGFQTVRTNANGEYEIADAPPSRAGADRYVDPSKRILLIEHPDFATVRVQVPLNSGIQDVHLLRPAVIIGRAVKMPGNRPIVGAFIQVRSVQNEPPSKEEAIISFGLAFAKTDEQGKYRITSLPPGTYDLWVDAAGLVSKGIQSLKTTSDGETAVPDLLATKGGIVRIRIVDKESHNPIKLAGTEEAQFYLFQRSAALSGPPVLEVTNGRFELHAFPGANKIVQGTVAIGDKVKWITRGVAVAVDVTDGKTHDVDVPLESIDAINSNAKSKQKSSSRAESNLTGTLTMRFEYDGPPPVPKEITSPRPQTKDDRDVGPIDAELFARNKIVDESLVVSEDRGLANVFMWVRSQDIPAPKAKNLPPVTVSFKNGQYTPRALAFEAPRQLILRNEETVACAFLYQGKSPIAQLVPAGQQHSALMNTESLPVRLSCMIHPWLHAYVFPAANPYFAISDEDGNVRIDDLPPGKWEFQTWHERCGYVNANIWPKGRFTLEIKPGEKDLGTIKLSPTAFEEKTAKPETSTPATTTSDTFERPSRADKNESAIPTGTQPPNKNVAPDASTYVYQPRGNSNYIEVKCVDAAGRPLENVQVRTYRMNGTSGERPQALAVSLTGSNGDHTFSRVIQLDAYPWFQDYPDGTIEQRTGVHEHQIMIVANSPGRASRMTSFPESAVFHHGAKIELPMREAAALTGRVTDTNSKPIADAIVSLNYAGIGDFQSARTDKDGRYTIEDATTMDWAQTNKELEKNSKASSSDGWVRPAFGPPELVARHPDYAEKAVEYERVPSAVDIVLERGGRIQGRVVLADEDKGTERLPVLQRFPVTVRFDDETESSVPSSQRADSQLAVRTDAEGYYEIGSLRPGKFSIYGEALGWFNSGVNAGLTDVEVRANETTTAPDLVLQKGTTVHVQLVDAASKQPVTFKQATRGLAITVPKPDGKGRTSMLPIFVQKTGQFDIRMPAGEVGLSVLIDAWEAQATMTNMFTIPKAGPFDITLPVKKKEQEAKSSRTKAAWRVELPSN